MHRLKEQLKDVTRGSIGDYSIAAATSVYSAGESVNTQLMHEGSNGASIIVAVLVHSTGKIVGAQVVDIKDDSD